MRILGLATDVGVPGKQITLGQQEPLGACGQYRVKYPLEALQRLGLAEVTWGAYPIQYAAEFAREFDIILLQRQTLEHHRFLVDHIRYLLEKKVVFDVDDCVLKLDPQSPSYLWWGDNPKLMQEALEREFQKKDFDNRIASLSPEQRLAMAMQIAAENRKGFVWMLENTDLHTCTTEVIAKEYGRYAKRIKVLPNGINPEDWEGIEPKSSVQTELTIGWAGSETHRPDMKYIQPAITRVLRQNKHVGLALVGADFREMFPDDVQDRLGYVPWTNLQGYKQYVMGFDIGIAPGIGNMTNRGKSGIRIYELGMCKKPVVASPWPYQSDVHLGMGLVASDHHKFRRALEKLINNPDLRKEMGNNLYDHVVSEHTYDRLAPMWLEAYQEVLN